MNNYSALIQEGFILKNSITQYKDGEENSTFKIKAKEDDNIYPDYYETEYVCEVKDKDSDCNIYLEREGEPRLNYINLNNLSSVITIYNDAGTVKEPIICIGYSSDFNTFEIKENSIGVPSDVSIYYDFCIPIPTIYEKEIKYLKLEHTGFGNINVLLRDNCTGYDGNNCGIHDEKISYLIPQIK